MGRTDDASWKSDVAPAGKLIVSRNSMSKTGWDGMGMPAAPLNSEGMQCTSLREDRLEKKSLYVVSLSPFSDVTWTSRCTISWTKSSLLIPATSGIRTADVLREGRRCAVPLALAHSHVRRRPTLFLSSSPALTPLSPSLPHSVTQSIFRPGGKSAAVKHRRPTDDGCDSTPPTSR